MSKATIMNIARFFCTGSRKPIIRVAVLSLCSCAFHLAGCGAAELKPVELFPEDECANCRMSVSDPAFASEMISQESEVFKFDDLACLEQFRKKRNDVQIAAIFVKDYETKAWLRYEKSRILLTGIETPMGSGRIAVSSDQQAKELTEKYPVKELSAKMGKECCASEECSK